MYAIREFRVGEVPNNECKTAQKKEAFQYAKDASLETPNNVNVINLDKDEVIATFKEGLQIFPK